MKILVMDEVKSRKSQIAEALEKSKHKVVQCSGSNDFLSALEEQSPNFICLDYDTWNHGRSIYNYFKVPKKIENMPMIIYNSPANFSAFTNRPRHDKDRILSKPSEPKAIVEALSESI
jgi:DNA-binding NtrC family response regulator